MLKLNKKGKLVLKSGGNEFSQKILNLIKKNVDEKGKYKDIEINWRDTDLWTVEGGVYIRFIGEIEEEQKDKNSVNCPCEGYVLPNCSEMGYDSEGLSYVYKEMGKMLKESSEGCCSSEGFQKELCG